MSKTKKNKKENFSGLFGFSGLLKDFDIDTAELRKDVNRSKRLA